MMKMMTLWIMKVMMRLSRPPKKGDISDHTATSAYSEGAGEGGVASDESESILRLPYLPISNVPWINPRKAISLKTFRKT